MEDYYVRAGSRSDALDPKAPLDQGRLASIFCRLNRERFDGLLHATSGASSASIGFRAGAPVTFVDATQGHALGEELVERGVLTRAQYSAVIARVTDGIVEDETVAFCEHAIELGFLTAEEAENELSERIRSRLIQVLSWTDCEVDFEPGEAALYGLRQFPQNPGAIVYMGVRTFYDEEYLEQQFPNPARTYLRLLAAPASISHFYGLDDEEFRLLRRFSPEAPLSKLLSSSGVERGHLLGLVMLLCVGDFCEISSTPQTQSLEREISGARPSPMRGEAAKVTAPPPATYRPSSPAMPTAPPATSRMLESYRPQRPANRVETVLRGSYDAPRTEHVRTQREARGAEPLRSQETARAREPGRNGYDTSYRTEPKSAPETARHAEPVRAPDPAPEKPIVDATREALLEAAARTAKSRKAASPPRRMPFDLPGASSGSSSSHHAVSQATVRGQSGTIAAPLGGAHSPAQAGRGNVGAQPARSGSSSHIASQPGRGSGTIAAQPEHAQRTAGAAADQQRPEYAKAHLNELIARRKQVGQAEVPIGKQETRDLRHARSLLREQQWVRAEELLRTLTQQEPNNTTLRTYHLWSRLRAQPHTDVKLIDELQDLAKRLVQDSEHGAFASYVLGHLHFSAKRDDLAEKFFKRAHAADPSNKDAERHLLILERRRQLAAEAEAANNRKLFGIPISKPKP